MVSVSSSSNQSLDVREQALENYIRALIVAEPLRLRHWDGCGLTIAQLRVLHILREQDGITVSALAARLNVTPATTTGLTDRLVREKLIYRTEDPTDRRLVRLHLTEEGGRIVGDLGPDGASYLQSILGSLSSNDINALNRGLEALVSAANGAAFSMLGGAGADGPRRRGRRRTNGGS